MSNADASGANPDPFESIIAGFNTDELDDDLKAALKELDEQDAANGAEKTNPLWKQPLAMIVTPIADAKVLAAVIRLAAASREDAGVQMPEGVRVIESESGALVIAQVGIEAAHVLAHVTSVGLKGQPVVMLWHQGAGDITSFRYQSGELVQGVSVGIVMAALDDKATSLMTRELLFSDVEAEGFDPMAISREEAVTWIAGGRGGWFRRKK